MAAGVKREIEEVEDFKEARETSPLEVFAGSMGVVREDSDHGQNANSLSSPSI
jgi:hypothetical protein